MSRPTAKAKIKDYDYVITLLGGDDSLEGFGVLASYLGGPLGQLLATALAKDKAPDLIGAAFAEIGKAMRQDDFRELVYRMLEGSTVAAKSQPAVTLINKGDRSIFNEHFRGGLDRQIALTWFAISENFGNFLDALPIGKKLLDAARAKGQAHLSQMGTTG